MREKCVLLGKVTKATVLNCPHMSPSITKPLSTYSVSQQANCCGQYDPCCLACPLGFGGVWQWEAPAGNQRECKGRLHVYFSRFFPVLLQGGSDYIPLSKASIST